MKPAFHHQPSLFLFHTRFAFFSYNWKSIRYMPKRLGIEPSLLCMLLHTAGCSCFLSALSHVRKQASKKRSRVKISSIVFSSMLEMRAKSVKVTRPIGWFPSTMGSFFTFFSNMSFTASASCMSGLPTITRFVIISVTLVSFGFLHSCKTPSSRSLSVMIQQPDRIEEPPSNLSCSHIAEKQNLKLVTHDTELLKKCKVAIPVDKME